MARSGISVKRQGRHLIAYLPCVEKVTVSSILGDTRLNGGI